MTSDISWEEEWKEHEARRAKRDPAIEAAFWSHPKVVEFMNRPMSDWCVCGCGKLGPCGRRPALEEE